MRAESDSEKMRLAQQSRSEDEAPARDPDEASRALERISQIFDEQDESGEKVPASDVRGDATPLGETAKKALKEVLADLHPADIAYVLEALPQDDRLAVWQLVDGDREGDILVEGVDHRGA